MEQLSFNKKVACDLAIRDARAHSEDENEYRIHGATPLDVDIYLSELGFDVDDTDYDGVCDSVFFTYSKDGLAITLEWNGWTGYVSVTGRYEGDEE
jgi:hypothetical protein